MGLILPQHLPGSWSSLGVGTSQVVGEPAEKDQENHHVGHPPTLPPPNRLSKYSLFP